MFQLLQTFEASNLKTKLLMLKLFCFLSLCLRLNCFSPYRFSHEQERLHKLEANDENGEYDDFSQVTFYQRYNQGLVKGAKLCFRYP